MIDIIKNALPEFLGGLMLAIALGAWGFFSGRSLKRRSSKDRNLNGLWYAEFSYKVKTKEVTKMHFIEIKQFKEKIKGHYLIGDAPSYTLEGRIRFGNYISGTWDNDNPNDEIHGSFILAFPLGVRGELLKGKWLGIDKERGIDVGVYHLKRIDIVTGRKAIRVAEQKCKELNISTTWTSRDGDAVALLL